MRYTWPKLKLCRREWINLFWTEKYDLSKNHRKPMGKGLGKLSDFGLQLRKKQAAKRMFGVTEKQFSSYYKKALKMSWILWENMLRLLELRFDNVVFKSNFARTIMQARQFTWHAHFLINGQKVDIPSYSLKVWDVIELREKLKESPIYKSLIEEFKEFMKTNKSWTITTAKWLDVNPDKLTITISRLPEKDDFDQTIDVQKIIEFYSK
ncbi:MAG: 30S ribosomal protein S4 [uncultured bacterium (gcode 4)]|uniref:Small ribosomal subunit protein uS4 n=1 Tax=uncultured bacterium (gcode 4) TaxID=1234023 RepID=K2GRM5_9BACT|nr:MAG: 30S ribosomal protein S4 [uncultured bacterium (gcode 4)]